MHDDFKVGFIDHDTIIKNCGEVLSKEGGLPVKQDRLYLALVILLLVELGCNLPAGVITTPTPTVSAIPTQVQDAELLPPTQTIAPEIQPTLTSESPTPIVLVKQSNFPIGFTTASEDGSLISFFDLSGKPLGSVQTPGMSVAKDHFHVAGPFMGNPQDVPIVYLSNENVLHLTEDFNPVGLSPDCSIVAYTEVNGSFNTQSSSRITLYNLSSGLMVPIDLAPQSDRGGGYAVFSPDNHYVAWMEGSGWMMAEIPNFHSRVRIANSDGILLADIPDINFASIAGDPSATWAVPSGWLDGETLLVEV